MKTVDFSETIAASDLKASRSSHLIEYMKVCEDFSETIEACDLKDGRYRQLNDFMKVYEY